MKNMATTLLSILLVIFFFITWIALPPINVKMSGASIPGLLPSIFVKLNIQFQQRDVLTISYLLYLIPIFSLIHLFSNFLGKNNWYLKLDYLIALITVVITYGILYAIDPTGPEYTTLGFWMTAFVSIIGVLVQAFQILIFIKNNKFKPKV